MPAENIFAAYAQPVRSVLDYQTDMDRRDLLQTQLQGAKRQNAIADLTAAQTRDTMQQAQLEREAMRAAAAQAGGDRKAYAAMLRRSGLPGLQTAAAAEEAALQKEAESQSKIGKEGAETLDKAIQRYRGALDFIDTPQGAARWLEAQYSDPMLAPHLRALGTFEQAVQMIPTDPQDFADWRKRSGMGMEKFAADQTQQRGQDVSRQTSLDTTGMNNAVSLAGQRRASADAAAGRAQSERLAAGAVTYQQDADGNLVALPSRAVPGTVIKAQAVTAPGAGMVPLPGKDANMTEGQAKALSFGSRMQQNRQVLDQLEAGGTFRRGNIKAAAETAGRVLGLGTDTFGGTLADIGGSAANVTQSPEQQRYETAMRNWIAANLRKESGAVIGTDEYRQAENQYFPQLGDSPKVIADKAALRRTAEQTMLAEVPRNKRTKDSVAPTTPKPGAVLRFDAQGNLLP